MVGREINDRHMHPGCIASQDRWGPAELHLLQRHLANSWTSGNGGHNGSIVGGLQQAPAGDELERFLCTMAYGRVRERQNSAKGSLTSQSAHLERQRAYMRQGKSQHSGLGMIVHLPRSVPRLSLSGPKR